MPERRPQPGHIWFGTRLRSDLHERFSAAFPQNGANQWWLNTMMELFLDQVEKDRGFEEQMRAALDASRNANAA